MIRLRICLQVLQDCESNMNIAAIIELFDVSIGFAEQSQKVVKPQLKLQSKDEQLVYREKLTTFKKFTFALLVKKSTDRSSLI